MAIAPLPCEQLLRESAETIGCTLWSASHTPGKTRHITVLIDKEGGATLGDCVQLMTQLQMTYLLLDDYLKNYAVDVATPGLDRHIHTLEHYQKSLYQYVEVKGQDILTESNQKNLRGYLISCDAENITLECTKDSVYTIPYSAIAKCRWIFNTIPYNRENA